MQCVWHNTWSQFRKTTDRTFLYVFFAINNTVKCVLRLKRTWDALPSRISGVTSLAVQVTSASTMAVSHCIKWAVWVGGGTAAATATGRPEAAKHAPTVTSSLKINIKPGSPSKASSSCERERDRQKGPTRDREQEQAQIEDAGGVWSAYLFAF